MWRAHNDAVIQIAENTRWSAAGFSPWHGYLLNYDTRWVGHCLRRQRLLIDKTWLDVEWAGVQK